MGTTAAALHLLIPPGAEEGSCAAAVLRAYERLGYVRTTKAGENGKRVTIESGAPGAFLSAYDSDNGLLDSGELKELAVILSAELHAAAIVTGVYDSDAFLFIVYHDGKQVDAALGGELWTADGLRILTPKARSAKWRALFAGRGAPAIAANADAVFAESILGEWCSAAGLDPARATTTVRDVDDEARPGCATLFFAKGAGAPPRRLDRGDRQVAAFFRSDDDHPYLQFFPAAWPVGARGAQRASWGIATSGPGFRGVRVRLDFDDASAASIDAVTVLAWPFFNGQVTSFRAAATHVWRDLGETIRGAAGITKEAADFEVPPTEPQSRNQFLLMLQVSLSVAEGREATVRPVIEALDGAFSPVALPPLRVHAIEPAWIPIEGRCSPDVALLLNEPAVASHVAILPHAAQPERARVQTLIETWLASLASTADAVATVRTEKHLTPAGNSTKGTWSAPAATVRADKRWKRSFDARHDYRSVAIEVARAGEAFPFAGASMAVPWRTPSRRKAPPTPDDSNANEALTVACWFVNEPSVYVACGTTRDAQEALFAAWIDKTDLLQAWIAEAAWFPDSEERTLYERAIPNIRYRGPQLASLTSAPDWPGRRLRFLARRGWLGPALAASLDLETLDAVATVRRADGHVEFALRDGRTLGDLERVLAPVLPSHDDIIAVLETNVSRAKEAARDPRARATYATALDTLATALADIAGHETGTERLERAIALFDEAIALSGGAAWPQGFASFQKGRTAALLRMGERTNALAPFEAAVAGQRAAVDVLGESLASVAPGKRQVWASARAALGVALAALGERLPLNDALEEAATLFESTIFEYTEPDDASLSGAGISDESNKLTRAMLAARAASVRLTIAVRNEDRTGAKIALAKVSAAIAILRASPNGKAFGDYDAWEARARRMST
jgi:tetratricopeptide (TPR) repeat protein